MKSGHRATFADEEVLSEYNCSKESIPLSESPNNNTNNTVDILKNRNGWEFCSYHCTILNEMENICLTENIKKSLADRLPSLRSNGPAWLVGDSLEINECKLHTPPMLFGRDFIEIRTGRSVLSLNACDAILCWAAQHSKEDVAKHPLAEVKVPYASNWISKTRSGLDAAAAESSTGVITAQELHADWTYSSDYICSCLSHIAMEERSGVVLRARELPNLQECTTTPSAPVGFRTIFQHESTHAAAVTSTASKSEPQPETEIKNKGDAWGIQCASESGVDYSMLRKQDEPILFYDEFLLYQDDLEDCGEIIFEAKIRVMPSCWFLLTKQYLRVDRALVRCREGRFFHNFSSDEEEKIHVEVCWRELSAQPAPPTAAQTVALAPSTLPSSQSIHPTVASSISTGSSRTTSGARAHPGVRPPMPIPPMCTSTDHTHTLLNTTQGRNMTHLLPMVNERETIPQFFTLIAMP